MLKLVGSGADRLPTQTINQSTARNGEQERHFLALGRIEAMCTAPDLEKDVLHGILDILGVAQEPTGLVPHQ